MNEQLQIKISAQIEGLKKGIADAKSQVSGFKDKVKEASANVDENFKKIGSGISSSLKAAGVGMAAAGAALIALGASTEEYRNNQAKLSTAFETAGASAETAKNTYNDLYRVLGDDGQATEAAAHLAKLTTNQKDLQEWTNICQGVYATFGDSLPIEGLTEAANETAKVGTVTGGLADALNWAGISEDAFNEKLAACNTEAEREKLIRETLNGVYNDAAKTYEANNSQVLAQNEAQAKLQSTMAALGEAMTPVITAFTNFANEALSAVAPYIQDLGAKALPALQSVLSTVADTLGKVMGFLVDNWQIVLTVAGVIGGIATAIGIYNTVAAIKAAMAAAEVTTVWALVAAYAAQAVAMVAALAPYLLIVAAIAAVIAIIVICVKHWDTIKEAVAKAWEFIKEKTKAAVDAVVGWFNNLKEKITGVFNKVKSAVSEKFNAIKETMGNVMQKAKETVSEKLNNIKDAYHKNGGGIKGVAAAAMEGVKGYYTAGYTFIDKLTGGKLSNIVNTMKSKMTAAKDAVAGVLTKIKEKFSSILEGAKNIVSNVINKIKGIFKFNWSLPKLKVPKFSITPAGWKIGDLLEGSIPKLGITWNAMGGVFEKPTIMAYGGSLQGLGEDGAEAVVPLEKNTQWLDRLAEMLAAKQTNTPIVLMVDKKVLAESSVSGINNLTKQTGSFPLVLA